jgi:DNA helicase-2/ATP-dependent DNA helicase PcrA
VSEQTWPQQSAAEVDGTAGPDLLRELDRRQRAAVTHGNGPLLVVAGAGTGKTRVITRRIAWLIATKRARPSEILALTFTDRAADEMQARVDRLVPYGYVDTTISTFHAFGDRLAREFALELGLTTDLRVLGHADAVVFLRERLFQLGLDRYRPLGDPTRFLGALVELFARAKDEDVSPADFAAHAARLTRAAERLAGATMDGTDRPVSVRRADLPERDADAARDEAGKAAELAEAFDRYQRMLAEAGCIDFGDQLALALRLVREHPAVRERLRRRFRYILVDEFQDTNPAQMELVAQLAGPARNVTAVGDDDQSIYRFRGAALGNILDFRERFGRARVIVLRTNHRSRAPILEAAYRLIRHNDPMRLEVRHGFDKHPVARRRCRRPEPVRHRAFPTVSDEADWVASDIARRIGAGVPPRDIAVLVRANADAEPVLRSLNMAGIPWRFSGASGLYTRPEVRALLAFLRAVADPDSTIDMYAVAAAAPYGLGGEDLTRLLEAARRHHVSLWSVVADVSDGVGSVRISPAATTTVRRLVADLRAASEMSHRRPAGEVLYDFLRRSGMLASLAGAGTVEADTALRNVARFFEIVRRRSELVPDPRIPFLARHLLDLVDAGDDPASASMDDEVDGVAVLTVHRAKGLEFAVVFLPGLADGRFPVRGRGEALHLPPELCRDRSMVDPSGASAVDELAEERRLFYVAMTRARDELIFTHAAEGNGRRVRRVSPFVAEALNLPRPVALTSPVLAVPPDGAAGLPDGPGVTGAIERIVAYGRPAAAPAIAPPVASGPRAGVSLSFSQLDDYLSCPQRYRFRHVLRIPTPPHHALAYGIALHQAVAAFGRSEMARAPLSEEDLLRTFDAAWTGEGFLSREHEEARLAAGRDALRRFREARRAAGCAAPVAVERDFIFGIDGVRLRGRFDRIDEEPSGPVVSDFKSSDVRDPARARQRARESLQLGVYALAYEATAGRRPEALQLVFLDSGVVGRVGVEERRLERVRERIRQAASGIRADAFEARPDAVGCSFCPFRTACPSAAA